MLTFSSKCTSWSIINQGALETDSFKIWVGDINCPYHLRKPGAQIIAGALDKVQQKVIIVESCDEGLKLQRCELLSDAKWQIVDLTILRRPGLIAATDSWMLFVSQEESPSSQVRSFGTLLNIKEAFQLMNFTEPPEIEKVKEKAILHFQSPDTAFSIIPAERESPEKLVFFCSAGNLELQEFIDYVLTSVSD
jgi:hypothetical protein